MAAGFILGFVAAGFILAGFLFVEFVAAGFILVGFLFVESVAAGFKEGICWAIAGNNGAIAIQADRLILVIGLLRDVINLGIS